MSRSKVTIISNMKNIFLTKINSIYGNKIRNHDDTIYKLTSDINRDLMTEIEDKILKEYPQLVKTLKCESNRTTCSTDHITVVFKHVPDTPDITAHKAQRKALQEQMINKKLELEQWEIECLQSALTDEGYPEFEITE